LAQRLTELSFADAVFFCNSGVEANEGAFKFARRWARSIGTAAKHEIIALRGAFHGRLFASLAATDRPSYRAPFRPLAGGVSIAERDLESLARALSAETVAALVVEPVQGEGGVRVFDEGYLRELRALTRERRIALVFDEIQCGLGRTGHLFGYQRVGVEPDIMTLAKPIAGGLPMGAILLTTEIARAVQPGDHGSTFGGGPFVASVARHVLERVADPQLLESVRALGQWLGTALRDLAAATARIRDVRGVGLIWGIDVHEPSADVIGRARDEGLLLVGAGDYTLRLLPPLIATRADLEEGLRRLQRALG
jgi:acetylornithine/N-succinyldiaminopimelate aminotransferase